MTAPGPDAEYDDFLDQDFLIPKMSSRRAAEILKETAERLEIGMFTPAHAANESEDKGDKFFADPKDRMATPDAVKEDERDEFIAANAERAEFDPEADGTCEVCQ